MVDSAASLNMSRKPYSTRKADLDLTPFIARGFSEKIDKFIANVPVDGIDRYHSWTQVRLAPETASFLYEDFTSTNIKYFKGSRPALEKIIDDIFAEKNDASDKEKVLAILRWVSENLMHAKFFRGDIPGSRALTEEELLESGWGWCNEQSRLFVSLAQIAGYPARMCSIYHAEGIHSHMTTEVFVDDKWSFADATIATVVELPDGSWASAKEISWDPSVKELTDKAYAKSLREMHDRFSGGVIDAESVWFKEPPHNMFAHIGLSNYPVISIKPESRV